MKVRRILEEQKHLIKLYKTFRISIREIYLEMGGEGDMTYIEKLCTGKRVLSRITPVFEDVYSAAQTVRNRKLESYIDYLESKEKREKANGNF